jgi:hypothetical protein
MLIRRVVPTLFALALLVPSTASALPNTTGGGGGTGPDPDAWPTARLVAPDHALQYSNVTLDASGSSDDDGRIVRYEWDDNGTAGWDRTTTSPRTTAYFGGYLNYTVKVRVTDDDGHSTTASAVIRVHPGPRARFFVAPAQPTAGTVATLVAKDSYAGGGGNPKFDWDLDGNGSYETPSTHGGYEPLLRTTFAAPGRHTVGLRVADRDGYTATTAETFTVKRARLTAGAQASDSGVLSAR